MTSAPGTIRTASGAPEGTALPDVGVALSRLYRLWGRRKMQDVPPVNASITRKGLNQSLVVEIAEEGERNEEEITVGLIADRLDVDPSAASRMVTETIKAGLLRRQVSQTDARRSVLRTTASGRELLERYRGHQQAVFEEITRDWPEDERHEFARLFVKYVDAMTDLRARVAPPDQQAAP